MSTGNDPSLPRILFIGAGSQANAYASPITRKSFGVVVAIAEPISYKSQDFGQKYIWGRGRPPLAHESFAGYEEFIAYEVDRRKRLVDGAIEPDDPEYLGVDAVFVTVQDALHLPVCNALAPLRLHVMCEKPLATTLKDCSSILNTLKAQWELAGGERTIFGIGHVLRYSPQNVLLRKLIREDGVIGEVVSLEHTEPIGWWHMAHGFVRGNWRRSDMTAPTLLTKCCHDIDFILWLLCSPSSPTANTGELPHLPTYITSTGHIAQFRKARKPAAAGSATNCLSCPIEEKCIYSAKKIYVDMHLNKEGVEWPLPTVEPEIEELFADGKGYDKAKARILEVLKEDYDAETPVAQVRKRPWFGRCVWECDNDVCDDQIVTMTWENDSSANSSSPPIEPTTNPRPSPSRGPKTALFHMTSSTESVCERRGRIYGTLGEITYQFDGAISVHTFLDSKTVIHSASEERGGGHGGGDDWLAENFCKAVGSVKRGEMGAEEAQRRWLGCDVEEVVRSHVAVFAAERARTGREVVDFGRFLVEEGVEV